ncbi:hypothetical protein N5C79_02130 [Pantoea brenneri]|uniref:hypothetical protein n=1 Tax=Pantoea brenneri TaxID=472694 RepID=UPI00244D2FD6|nr:hypothetical protein [Pantoea brenneri]MDH1085287.1 hypothetical protein [Pantoea brenneri]
MSKIARYAGNLKAFGSDAQGLERTLFGETTQADDLTSQVTPAFLRGWGVVGPSEHPSMEDFNAAMYAMSQFIAYQHQMGVPEWDAKQEYYIGSICSYGGELYQSLENANVGNQPPSIKWNILLTSKNGTGRLLNVQVFNAAGQYTPTPGMKFILAHMIGGGGASGGTPATASNQTGGSAAGNSGAYAFIKAYANDIGAGKAINIGAGGTTQVNGSGFAGGTTSIADIADVTGGYGSIPGSVSATTAVAQPSYGKPVVNKYNKTEIIISSLGSQASNFLQSATGSGTGWISPLSPFPGGELGRGGSGIFVNASTAAQPGLAGNRGAVLIMEYA